MGIGTTLIIANIESDETASAKKMPVSRFSTNRSGPAGTTTKSRNVDSTTTSGAMDQNMSRPSCSSRITSAEKVEKVVSPPRNPVITNSRHSGGR